MQTPLQLGLECLKAGKVDEAIEHLELATSKFKSDYQGFNYLGIAYAQKKSYNRAIGAFLAALQLRPNIPSIHLNLGLAYQKDGLFDKAREEFQTALSLDPSYTKARDALAFIDSHDQSQDSVSSGACARHTDEPAVAVCSFCRLPVCNECRVVQQDQVLCSRCSQNQE